MATRRTLPIDAEVPAEDAPGRGLDRGRRSRLPASLPDDLASLVDGWLRVVTPASSPALNPAAAAVLARIIRFARDGMRQDGSRTEGSP